MGPRQSTWGIFLRRPLCALRFAVGEVRCIDVDPVRSIYFAERAYAHLGSPERRPTVSRWGKLVYMLATSLVASVRRRISMSPREMGVLFQPTYEKTSSQPVMIKHIGKFEPTAVRTSWFQCTPVPFWMSLCSVVSTYESGVNGSSKPPLINRHERGLSFGLRSLGTK